MILLIAHYVILNNLRNFFVLQASFYKMKIRESDSWTVKVK